MSIQSLRDQAISALQTVLTKRENCITFEKLVFNRLNLDLEQDINKSVYKWCIYNVIGILGESENQEEKKQIANDVKKGKIGWKSSFYDNISAKIDEFDEYLVKPFEVTEGVNQCGKCGSKKTWNVQKQVRASDEPMSVFSRCVECGHSWSYHG